MAARPPRRKRARWLLMVLAILAVAWFYRTARLAQIHHYPPNAFFEVKRGDMLISVAEDGALRAVNETSIRSGLEGQNRIISLVPEGVYVKKGELLVELDSAGLRDRLNEQELAVEERKFFLIQARENLKFQKSLAESQIKDSELRVELSERDLEKYRDGDAPLLLRTAEARITVLREQVRIASERLTRTEQLFKDNNATRSELEADQLTLKREQLALAQYEEDLRLIKKFDQPTALRSMIARIEQSKQDLERLRQRSSNEIAQIEADLKTSERSAELMDENLNSLKRKLENAKIFAPQDGLVVYADVSPFQFFGGGNNSMPQEGRFRMRDGRSFFSEGGGGRRRSGGFGSSAEVGTLASSSSSSSASSSASPNSAAAGESGNAAQAAGGSRGSSSGAASAGSQSSGFVSYPSLRPSSTLGASAANNASSGGSSLGSGSGSGGGQASYGGGMNQNNYRRNFDWGPSEIYGAPTVIQEGIMVRQRQELIRLPDVSKMLAEIKIREEHIRLIKAGMTAYVRVETVPDRNFKATVRRVALLPDAQASWLNPDVKLFPADLLIDDELPALKPGVSARVEIIVTNLAKVLSVPIQAVVRDKGHYVCFIKHGAKVIPSPVKMGFSNDRFVEIISGLDEGDRVLLAPTGDEAIEPARDTNEVNQASIQTNAAPSQMENATESENGEGRRGGRGGRGQGGGRRPRAAEPEE